MRSVDRKPPSTLSPTFISFHAGHVLSDRVDNLLVNRGTIQTITHLTVNMPSGLLRLMRLAQYVSLVLAALGWDELDDKYALGTPKSDPLDHVDPCGLRNSTAYPN